MLIFCPTCSNLLIISSVVDGYSGQHFVCKACPYMCPVGKPYKSRQEFTRKKVDDVLGGADAWENVDSIEVSCPKCEHNRAYYMQIQIRSADEPSSIFYKCCNSECGYQWREG